MHPVFLCIHSVKSVVDPLLIHTHIQIYCQFFFPPFNMKSQVFLFHTSYMHNPWNWIQLEDFCLFLCVHVCRVLRFWIWGIQSDGGYEFCAPSPIARTLCMWRGLGGGVVLSPRNTTVCLHSVQQTQCMQSLTTVDLYIWSLQLQLLSTCLQLHRCKNYILECI